MVSVIIPTYNREKLIKRSIESVLAQTYADLECIVVDDGSTDNTQFVVEAIPDHRVKYVKLPEGKGANAARNFGVSIAKGEYIAFQDSDDVWMKDKLEKQLILLKQHQADIVSCPYVSLNKEDRFVAWDNMDSSRFLSFLDFFPSNLVSTQTILGKRECFIQCPFDNSLPRLQDYDLAIRLVTSYKIWLDLEPLVYVDTKGERISSNNQRFADALTMIFDKVANMSWNQEEKNEALSRLFRLYMPFWLHHSNLEASYKNLEASYKKVVEHYENSTCWKITKPLRVIMDFFRQKRCNQVKE